MKRKFYFIKDNVSGNFYTGRSADDISTFDNAAVYYQRKNAEDKIKTYVNDIYGSSWGRIQKSLASSDLHWGKSLVRKLKRMVNERKDLPNWGIEIVEVEIVAP